MKRQRWAFFVAGALVVLVAAVVLLHDAVIGMVAKNAALGAGYAVNYERLHVGSKQTDVAALDVRSVSGEPLFTAQHVSVAYSLSDLVRRSANRLFGLVSIEIDHPHLTLVHHPDGTWNFPAPSQQGNSNTATLTIPTVKLRVIDGSATLTDLGRRYPLSRHLGIDDLNIAADLTPTEVATWSLRLALLEGTGRYRIEGKGRLDPQRGYEVNRITASDVPIGPVLNYVLDTAAVNVASGDLHALDVCYCALLSKDGTMGRHLTMAAHLDNLTFYLGGLAKPIRDGSGEVYAYDDGITAPALSASVSNIPVRVSGGIVQFSKPQFRLGVLGKGSLAQLTDIAGVSAAKLKLAGPLSFGLLVEGAATSPLLFAGFASPGISYAGYELERPSGLVALNGTQATIVRAKLHALGIDVGAHGMLTLDKRTDVEVAANASGATDAVPYAALALPGLDVRGEAVAAGPAASLAASGELDGSSPTQTLATTFAIDGKGTGNVGPLRLEGPGGESLVADVALDKRNNDYSAVVDAHDVSLTNARLAQSGVREAALAGIPPFDAVLNARVAAVSDGKNVLGAGNVDIPSAHLRGASVGTLSARFTGDQTGSASLEGEYRGDLASLAAAAGATLPARGSLDLPFAASYSAGTAVAQIRNARFEGARLDGVELRSLSGTVGVRGSHFDVFDVYGLDAELANGSLTASGSFGNGGTLDVSTSNLDLAPIAAAFHAPVSSARLSAFATVGGTAAQPDVDGGLVLSDTRVAQSGVSLGVGASAGIAYSGDRLSIRNGDVLAGPAVGTVDADVDGVRSHPSSARYTVAAHVRDADIATLARLARASVKYPEGTLDADFNVAGSGSQPNVAGSLSVPEGSINGLAFHDAALSLEGTPANVHARGGSVTVGSSTLGFDGDVAPSAQRFALRGAHVNLADFNDYFDAGDTLGGKGSLDVAVTDTPARITTRGTVALANVRYRQLPLGDTSARWSTAGRTIDVAASVGGEHGLATTKGTITLAATRPLDDALHRTSFDLATNLNQLDLGTWLPLVNVHAPVEGYIDAATTVRGRFPGLAFAGNASLERGLVGRIPVTRAEISANASNGRATIANAVFEIPNLTVTASGSTGLVPTSTIALTVRATSPNVGDLAHTVTGQTAAYSGALAAAFTATGSLANPNLGATADLTTLKYQSFIVPRVHADVALVRGRDQRFANVALRTAEVDLQSGTVIANGNVPIALAPAFGLRQEQPLSFDVAVRQVALAQFASALPKGTQLTGTLDGNVALAGTLLAPTLGGQLALAGGSFVGPQEKNKITDLGATLAFAGTSADLRNLHMDVGGGTIDGTGHAQVPSLRDPSHDLTYNLSIAANRAVIDAPQYLSGRIDGTITVARGALDAMPTLGGSLAVQNARIPLTAIFNPSAPAPAASTAPIPLALDLDVKAVHDVRVQSGQVDIGALGQIHAGGTLGSPKVSGEFDSTDGTVSFYRTFRLESGTVAFSPDDGVIPTIDATATTTLTNPETDVTLNVTGLATQLNVNLSSDPAYSRSQILGLLLGLNAFGAVNGVAAGGAPQSGVNPVTGLAEGQLGTLLTRNVLEPLGANLGGAVGLSSLAINYDPFGGGGLSVGAQKKLFKNVNAVFAESFNYPQRSSLGLLAKPNDRTAIQLTFFSQEGSGNYLSNPNVLNSTSTSVTAAEPANGTSGFAFSFQRKY